LLGFAWPVLLLIAVFALVGWPWANSQTQNMRQRYQQRGDLERIAPGEFRESSGRIRVFFIDKDTPDATTASNVFISSVERNLQIVTSARNGRIENVGDTRYLMLGNGQRLERTLDHTGLKISEFETYGTKVGGDADIVTGAPPLRARSSLTLLREGNAPNRGELGWRIGMVLAAFNFVLLALTVSSVNPRVGRSGNLLLALFAFVIYYNLLNLGQNWVGAGRFSMGGYLLTLHGGALLLGIGWLGKRHYNWSFRNLLKPSAARASA
jgi:lipopolysaccharide export system permease protein